MGRGIPPPVPRSPWPCFDRGLPSPARLESLRRSIEVVSRVLGAFHRSLFSQHHEVSSIASVPHDDFRPRPGRSGHPRPPLLFLRQPTPCFRPRSVFLFSLSPGAGPRFRRASAPAFRYGFHSFLLLPPPSLGGPREAFPPDYGSSLPVVYLIWIAVVAISYPICLWYANLKNRRRDLWWLSYL
jgi:hypothetical protein